MENLFKKKSKEPEKALQLHPQNQKAIELVFEADGERFYRFKSVADLPQIRQTMAMQFLHETGQVVDAETLTACLENLADLHSKKDDAKFYHQIALMRDMANGLNYTDAFYHVCSALTFTLDENIEDYDPLIAQSSIEKFKRLKQAFFLTTLSAHFPSMQIRLPSDLERNLATQRAKLRAVQLALQSTGVELPMSSVSKHFNSGQGAI